MALHAWTIAPRTMTLPEDHRFPIAKDERLRETVLAALHEADTLGRLELTFDGFARRDTMVLSACREIGVPLCSTIAGGNGARIDDTVDVRLDTMRVAARYT